MRDPERIPKILELISQLWLKDEDLRFNQLIYILQTEYSNKHGEIGKVVSTTEDGYSQVGFDLFNAEDDQFLDFLRNKRMD